MATAFQFKHFQVLQGDGAWKVTTDSVLLGSWCRVTNVSRAADIGTGSGILCLMLAQRNPLLRIDGIEIEPDAIAEAKANIANSRWSDRITLIEGDAVKNTLYTHASYDLIICNPPYFPQASNQLLQQVSNKARQTARQGNLFSFLDVPGVAQHCLKKNGKIALVIPSLPAYTFIECANRYGYYVQRRLSVKHSSDSPESLELLELSDKIISPVHEVLILYEQNKPTQEYRSLCADFISI